MAQSYWSNGTLSITVDGPNGEGRNCRHLAKPFALLGSDPNCDLVLDGPRIANRSLLVTATHRGLGGIVLCTMAKRAGRFFRIDEDRPIKLRSFRIGVQLQAGSPGQDQLAGDLGANSIWAITWKSASIRHYLQLPNHRPILVGRQRPAHVMIEDHRLSGVHCCLYRDCDQLWVIDLCSANGTWVSKSRVDCERLGPGHSMRIGQSRVHFLQLHTDAACVGQAQEVQALSQQRATVQANYDRQQDQLRELQQRIEQQQIAYTEIERLQLDTLLMLRLQQEEQERARQLNDQQVAEHGKQVAQFELQCKVHAAEQLELKSAQQALAVELAAAEDRLEHLRQQCLAADAGRLQSERELADATASLEVLGQERDAAELDREQLTAKLRAAELQLDELGQRRETAETQLKELRLDVAERERILRSAELDASRREVELIAMKAQLRLEREELARLRETAEHDSQSAIMTASDLAANDLESDTVPTVSVRISNEACLMSPDFVHILGEAIELNPELEE